MDTSVATIEPRFRFLVDRQKAALSGLSQAQVARGLAIAEAGETVGRVHVAAERLPLSILLRGPWYRVHGAELRPTLFQKPFQEPWFPCRNWDEFDLDLAARHPSCGKTWSGWCSSPETPRA